MIKHPLESNENKLKKEKTVDSKINKPKKKPVRTVAQQQTRGHVLTTSTGATSTQA